MIVARRFVRDRARGLLWWGSGMFALVASSAALYPSVRDAEGFDDIYAQLPKAVRALFGADVSINAPAGYLNARHFSSLFPLILLFFAIGLGARAIAGHEEDGTLETTLALPIDRVRLAVERFAAVQALVVLYGAFTAAVVLVLAAPFGLMEGIGALDIVVASATVTAMGMFHAALAFAVGAATGRRMQAIGVSASIAVVGYILHGAAAAAPSLHWLRLVSPWYWFIGRNTLVQGAEPAGVLLPLVGAAVLAAAGIRAFRGRDLR